jgi:hypothetical protein
VKSASAQENTDPEEKPRGARHRTNTDYSIAFSERRFNMANSNGNMNKDGKTVWERYLKALETCHKKFGDRAHHVIEGVTRRQFGDMPVEEIRAIAAAGEWWKLILQSQRVQHLRATETASAVEKFDLLMFGVVPDSAPKNETATSTDLTEAVPF